MAPVHCSAVSLLGGDWSIPATYAAELFSARGCARLGTASPSASQSSSFPHVVARGRGQRHHKRRSRALSCTWLCEARGQRHLAPIKCFALFEPPASMRHLCSNGTRPTPASLLVLGMDYVIVLHSRAHLDRWRPFLWCRPHLRRSPLCPPGVGHG